MKRQKLHSKRHENLNRRKNRDNNDRSEIEHYKGLLRSAEKEIKSLRQQLRYYEKYSNDNDKNNKNESVETPDNVHIEQKYSKPCHECGKGFMEEFEIIGKIYGTCNICGHRERLK